MSGWTLNWGFFRSTICSCSSQKWPKKVMIDHYLKINHHLIKISNQYIKMDMQTCRRVIVLDNDTQMFSQFPYLQKWPNWVLGSNRWSICSEVYAKTIFRFYFSRLKNKEWWVDPILQNLNLMLGFLINLIWKLINIEHTCNYL